MMQQQICQPEQMGQQQPQQVMLCPVRLVYETQILVQPGEQIQPNQTLFINPQNPPPWIQNRPQNQVIYMQQMPSNMVPSVQQHMDQNQMYLQNLQNYYPQQMIQMDQMRQMQNVVQMMPNINNINQITGQNVNNIGQNVTLNVGQNVSNIGQNVSNIGQNVSNIGQNVSNIGQTVSNMGQNVMSIANVVQNVNQKPNVVNTVNVAQNSNDRVYNSNNIMQNIQMTNQSTISNVQMQDRTVNMNHNLVNMQKVAELQGMRPNVRQPQVTVSPMQNVKYAQNVGDLRPTTPNVGDIRPANSPRPMNATNISSIPNNIVQANLLNKKVPLPNKPNSVMASPVRHYNQTYYRHIQPKPMSVVPIQNQYLPMATQTLVPNQVINDVNRKRKSESPDDTRKKIPNMSQVTVPIIANQTMSIVPNLNNKIVSAVQTDAGVNTNPVQIKKGSPVQQKLARPIQTASTGTQANIVKEKPQVVEMKVLPPLVKDNVQIESDKLVRNTVFTQARGLLRSEPQIMQPDVISIEKIETVVNPIHTIETSTEKVKAEEATKMEAPEAMKIESPKECKPVTVETPKPNEIKTETTNSDCDVSIYIKIGTGTKTNTEPVKLETSTNTQTKEIVKQEVQLKKEEKPMKETPKPKIKEEKLKEKKPERTEAKKEVVEAKPVKKEAEVKEIKEVNKKFTVTAISDFKGSELQIADGSVRKEDNDSFILTHVLDGYVIQESNTAFPIRRPLKEKTIYQNTDLTDQKREETPYKHRTEDGKLIKDNSKILTISDLNLNEEEIKSEEKTEEKTKEKTEEKSDEDEPFANLKPAAIKSWTVDQLAEHLSKYKWTETISVLSEHEIDGESLFLVSKQQLVQIGVSETHADVICEFIKKS